MIDLQQRQTTRPNHRVCKPLHASLLCICAGMFFSAHAQISTPPAAATGAAPVLNGNMPTDEKARDMATQPRNAYAEHLKPKIRRPAGMPKQPYEPIKQQDDQGQVPEIEMFVGESRVFPAPRVARIAVGNGQIMTAAALDSKEVLIFANGVGTSSLFVWSEDGRYQRVKVHIVPGDTTRIAREIAAFLARVPNAKTSIVGDKVIVEGDSLSDADLTKIEQLEKRYPQIVNFTNRLGWEQMVMMDVKVVEFPKNELRDIGLKWSAAGGAALGAVWQPVRRGSDGPFQVNVRTGQSNPLPITSPDGTASIVLPSAMNVLGAVNLGLNAQLNLLVQEGKASVLAEPQLSARNGSKASFLAGGEFPYTISTINGISVFFKPYGIKLDIVPRVDRNGIVRATIESEVSKIDPSLTSIGGPALLTRKTNTEFNVNSGDTIVLSGLIQIDNSTNIDKVPVLGDVPILGALFRSKRFQNNETELVVFVTPSVIDSRSPGLVDRVERTNERLQQNLGRQPYLNNPQRPAPDPAKINMEPAASKPMPETRAIARIDNSAALVSAPVAVLDQRVSSQPSPSGDLSLVVHNPTKSGSMLRVRKNGLIVRAEPNLKSRPLRQLRYGSLVQSGVASLEPASSGVWRNVVVDAINGWVLSAGVEPAQLMPVSKPYNGVVASAQKIRTLAQGQEADVLAQAPHGDRMAVRADGNSGWAAGQ